MLFDGCNNNPKHRGKFLICTTNYMDHILKKQVLSTFLIFHSLLTYSFTKQFCHLALCKPYAIFLQLHFKLVLPSSVVQSTIDEPLLAIILFSFTAVLPYCIYSTFFLSSLPYRWFPLSTPARSFDSVPYTIHSIILIRL